MIASSPLPKLPKLWKRQFLKALKEGCYIFTKGTWVRKLEVPRTNRKGQIKEYSYCTLGAAYHFSTGENEGPCGHTKEDVPEAFKNQDVRSAIARLNDKSSSFAPTIKWIEENL